MSTDPDDVAVDSFGRIIQPRGENSESRRGGGGDSREESVATAGHETTTAAVPAREGGGREARQEGSSTTRETDRGHDRGRDRDRGSGGHGGGYRGSSRDRDRDRGGGFDRGRGSGGTSNFRPPGGGGSGGLSSSRDSAPTGGGRGGGGGLTARPGSRFGRGGPPPPHDRDRGSGGGGRGPHSWPAGGPLPPAGPYPGVGGGGRPPSPPRLPVAPGLSIAPVHHAIRPLMSFKNFIASQSDDCNPDEFQRRYDEYHLRYVNDFSNAFFNVNKGEEWFQERYNPLRMAEQETANALWAAQESAAFVGLLASHPTEAVEALCLDQSTARPKVVDDANKAVTASTAAESSVVTATPIGTWTEVVGSSSTTAAASATEEGATAAASAVAESSSSSSKKQDVITGSIRHVPGHEDRTIYVCGVDSVCTKAVLRTAVTEALTKENLPPPDRVILSQPVWTQKLPSKFERNAWVVMPTAESAKQALKFLRDFEVGVPGPPDPEKGEHVILMRFTVQASLHNPNKLHTVPSFMHRFLRVNYDTKAALELAALLDEDRQVPAISRLSTILDPTAHPEIASALKKPTDKLDVAIAYLRRAHFVTFYGGRRFRDESHLLTSASSLLVRVNPCTPSADEIAAVLPADNYTGVLGGTGIVASVDTILRGVAPPHAPPGAPSKPHGDDDQEEEEEEVDHELGRKRKREDDDEEEEEEVVHSGDNDNAHEGAASAASTAAVADDVHEGAATAVVAAEDAVVQDGDAAVTATADTVADTVVAAADTEKKEVATAVEEEGEEGEEGEDEIAKHAKESTITAVVTATAAAGASTTAVVIRPPRPARREKQFPLTDGRIVALRDAVRHKLMRKEAQKSDPLVRGTQDEEDAKAIAAAQEKTFERCVEANCPPEPEGKARCCFAYCKKLFKGNDFLKKHLKTKHDTFAFDILLGDAEPFMRVRYEAEDILARPLALIQVEAQGELQLKSVKEIIEKGKRIPSGPVVIIDPFGNPLPMGPGLIMPLIPGAMMGPGPRHGGGGGGRGGGHRDNRDSGGGHGGFNNRGNRGSFDGPGNNNGNNRRFSDDGGDRGRRGSDARDRRSGGFNDHRGGGGGDRGGGDRGGGDVPGNKEATTAPPPPPKRTFMDVDEPTEKAVSIDYGVTILPPAKKRKSVTKKPVE